ncbi:MAG: hypothetical protein IJW16_00710 [Clostridia bacterium]|nr:hypothetical protein [Clostridia bacterium]
MGYRSRRRRRRIRLTVALIAVLLCSVFLVSCMASANVTWVRALLGYDVTDYESEAAVATLSVEDARAAELCEMVEILSADRGIRLEGFENTSEAVSLYRDAILGYMLRGNYSRYTGNRDTMEAVQTSYPQMQFSTLIPAQDFENTVFRYFGGVSVKNESGALYSYLNRADCYTAPVQRGASDVQMNVQTLEETAHTYRMTFSLTNGEGSSENYTAVFLKRDDGTCYFRSLAV